MITRLPGPIALFFDASNGTASGGLADCFAADAVVLDEGHSHRGREAIASWLREARERYRYRVEPLGIVQKDEHVVVASRLSGHFDGSPVNIEHTFKIAGDKIQSLEIR